MGNELSDRMLRQGAGEARQKPLHSTQACEAADNVADSVSCRHSPPIFIIGTERSGSNLLRLILDAHPHICVPHPPHILKYFAPRLSAYGDLCQPENLRSLVADVRGLITNHIHPWEAVPSIEEIMAAVGHPSLIGVFFGVYRAHCRTTGKPRWGCKSTFVIDHLPEVLAVCPTARFLFLVRDPRDVAVSSRKSIFSPCHPWLTARLWRRQQETGWRWLKACPENVMLVRYEDLLAEPEPTVRRICEFLEEKFDPGMLEFHQGEAARRSSELSGCWRNTGRPIQTGNTGRYRRELSSAEISLIEATCGELMARFGYQPERSASPNCPPARRHRFWFRLLDLAWRLKVEARAARRDRNYLLHWRRRLYLLRLRL